MAKVVDFGKHRARAGHDRDDARADSLKDRLAASREEAARKDPEAQAKATRRLLDLFRKPPRK